MPTKKYKSSQAQSKTKPKEMKLLLLTPAIFVLAILPLIARYHSYDPKLSEFSWFGTGTSANDFFLYWKQQLFTITLFVMAGIVAVRAIMFKKRLSFSKIFIPLIVYALMALLSSIFCDNLYFAFHGNFSLFENIWCILGYAMLVYYIFLIVEDEKDISILMTALLFGAGLLALLGTFQAFGKDFFNTSLGKSLLLPSQYRTAGVEAVFGEKRVYMSLDNPNYVGVYTALTVPIFMVLLFFNRSLKKGIAYLIIVLALLFSMFGSQSKAGLIGIGASILLILILIRKLLIKRWKITVPILAAGICGFFIINFMNNNAYLNAIKDAFSITKAEEPNLTDIKTLVDHIEVTYKGNTLNLKYTLTESFSYSVYDEKGNEINTNVLEEGNTVQIVDERFPGFQIRPALLESVPGIEFTIDSNNWYFSNSAFIGDSSYYYFNSFGGFIKIIASDSNFFKGYEQFASGRGYIWSRTLPLLSKHAILGAGANNFVFEFPHQDYVGSYNNGHSNSLITKPHNMYLQIGVQSGILSLLAFIIFYLLYFVSSIRLYLKNSFKTFSSQVGAAILTGTFSYMIMGLSNDSSITTAPVFWAVIGIGIAVNHMVKKDKVFDNAATL